MKLVSGMVCGTCTKNIGVCQCPDIDDRMRNLAMNPTMHFAAKWCIVCDHYWARCKCEAPVFRLYIGGKQVDPSEITNALGVPLTQSNPEIGYDPPLPVSS